MTPHDRDHLDEAIDRVARRLTDAPADPDLAARIAEALPPRRSGVWGLMPAWAPHCAVVTILATAAVLWSMRTHAPAPVTLPAAAWPALSELAAGVDAHQSIEFAAARNAARREPLAPVRTPPLAPVAPLDFLEPLESLEPLDIAPLAIARLPLAVDDEPRYR